MIEMENHCASILDWAITEYSLASSCLFEYSEFLLTFERQQIIWQQPNRLQVVQSAVDTRTRKLVKHENLHLDYYLNFTLTPMCFNFQTLQPQYFPESCEQNPCLGILPGWVGFEPGTFATLKQKLSTRPTSLPGN